MGYYKHYLIAVVFISLFSLLTYSNTLDSPFVFDDIANIRQNSAIRLTDWAFQEILDAASKSPLSNRPVANISFAINYYLGEYDVTGYHLVNILIHLINGIFVYLLGLIIFKQIVPDTRPQMPFKTAAPPFISLFAALLFVAHPIQTQSVTYVVQRMNSMAVLFSLLSLLLFIYGRLRRTMWVRWALFSGSLLLWVVALGCKEIAVILPFVVLLFEWYFFQDLQVDWVKVHVKYVVGLALVLGLLAVIYMGQSPIERILSGYKARDFTMPERVVTQFRVLVLYISLIIFPHPSRLNLLHHLPTSQSLLTPVTTLFSFLAVVGLIGFAIVIARRYRVISFGIIWFFMTLVLESSVLSLEMVFEHRLYLPMFGFVLVASGLLFYLFSKRPWGAFFVSSAIILCLSVGTYARNETWESRISLWTDVLSKNPRSFRAHTNLGKALARMGSTEQAIEHYRAALNMNPTYIVAHQNLGLALEEKGHIDKAIEHYLAALKVKPGYVKAHTSLGAAFDKQGRTGEAIQHYMKALEMSPDNAKAHNNLGVALARQGQIDEAMQHVSQALQINSEYADAHNNLGILLFRQGDTDGAINHFREALRINPDYREAKRNLRAVMMMEP